MNAQRDFRLPDFTRVMWGSARARAVWEPRIQRIAAAWDQIERWSVADGVRPSALQSVEPEALVDLAQWASARALVALPLGRTGSSAHYSASAAAVVDGQPWTYRVAVTRQDLAVAWSRAWAESDDDRIGTMLGFPHCCRQFFAATWGAGSVDPTGQMAAAGEGGRRPANSLLRWLGVRLVPHMPCSFACTESDALGFQLAGVGRAHGYPDEVDWIEQMLDWPIEWSALHGIAEIKTPVLKIAARTDYTPGVQTIRRAGLVYPDEGVSGNTFPYQRPATVKSITLHRSFKAAFVGDVATDWTDNGFTSREAMDAAHGMILEALDRARPTGVVADLGCGNATLLRRIKHAYGCVGIGLETNAERRARAVPGVIVRLGQIADIDRLIPEHVDVVLVSDRRFDEGNGPVIEAWARTRAQRLLRYSYDEPQSVRLEEFA